LAGTLLICVLALGNAHANAQAGAVPPTARNEIVKPAAQPPTTDDVCRTLEQAAAENALPTEFFARVIWQESRFNARALSSKGARGIAQFMPQTAHWHGLRNPFNPIEALRHSASYLRELREQFGNLGLAAAAYNAGPGRVTAWLMKHRLLPGETRNYVAMVTGWTADEWTSPSPPHTADTTIPQGIPCTRLANLVVAESAEAKQPAANAQEHIAVPIDGSRGLSPSHSGSSSDADSIAPGGEKSTAPSSLKAAAPQASTSAHLRPQTDGAAPASPAPLPGASPTGAIANAQKLIAVTIEARADSTRPTAEARASGDAESTAAGGEKSTAPSIPESPAPQAGTSTQTSPQADGPAPAPPAPWPDASPTVSVPRWGVWLAANLSESKAWALYRERLRRFASLIGDREPVVLFRQLPGLGTAKRYIIAIADDDRVPLDKFCEKLTAAGSTCDVMRNEFGP
jgi:hypothetical protein